MLYHFFRECLNPKVRINKMVNKPNVNYQPSPSGLTSSYQPMMNDTLCLSIDHLQLCLFREILFFRAAYPIIIGESFKFMVFRLLENVFAIQKIESINVYSCLSGKSSPEVLSSHTGRRKLITIRRAALF